MRADYTEIAFVLDRSGSMNPIAADAIGGFNTFLASQQALPGEARLTLVLFDHEYLVVHDNVAIRQVPPLDAKTFVPRGMTALLDAVGRTIDEIGLVETEDIWHAQKRSMEIKGAVRADFFWGWGDEALALAGRTKQNLAMWVLWPQGAGPVRLTPPRPIRKRGRPWTSCAIWRSPEPRSPSASPRAPREMRSRPKAVSCA